MKKIVLYSVLSLVSLTLVGCSGSNANAAVKDLNNQLSRCSNTVSDVQKQDLSSIASSSVVNSNNQALRLYQNSSIANTSYSLYNLQGKVSNDVLLQSMLSEEVNEKINTVQSMLKNSDKKYTKNQVKALRNLTGQLSDYTIKLNNNKKEATDPINMINHNRKINHISLDGIGVGYNSMSNVLEIRKAYFYNILNTLSQIESLVNNGKVEDNAQNDTPAQVNNNENDRQTPVPYSNEDKNEENNTRRNINIPDNFKEKEKTNTSMPTPPQVIDNTNRFYNNPYVNNGYGYNGYNGFGYNPGYYGGAYRGVTNPGRNTDTYRPNRVNIDSYRVAPNGYGYNGFYGNGYYNSYNNVVPTSAEYQTEQDLQINKDKVLTRKDFNSNSKKLIEKSKDMAKIKKPTSKDISKNIANQ